MFRWLLGPDGRALADQLRHCEPDRVEAVLAPASARRQVDGLVRALSGAFLEDVPRLDLFQALAHRDPVRAFERIDLAWDADELDLVVEVSKAVLRVQPGHVAAADHLIRALLVKGEFKRAQGLLDRAPRNEPTFQLLRAELLIADESFQEAGELLREIGARAEAAASIFQTDNGAYWRDIALRADRLRSSALVALNGQDAVLKDAASSGKLLPRSGVNHMLVGQAGMADSGRVAASLVLKSVADSEAWAAERLAARPSDRSARTRMAEARLRCGDRTDALRMFRGLVDEDPSWFPGQLGLGALLRFDESRSGALLQNLPPCRLDPEWLPVLPDWYALEPEEQQIVAHSATPLARALPGLLAAGARIQLLPIDVRPVDLDELAQLDGTFSEDGRRLAGIGGLASSQGIAVARIEGLRCIGESWVFGHELAHLAFWALPEADQLAFMELFDRARRLEWAWSQYQQSNVDEFFAVSYEDLLLERYGGKRLPPDKSGLWREVATWLEALAPS